MEVQKNSFIPEPEVSSEVIKLTIRNKVPVAVKNKELMFKIIKNAFMQRRKTLLNSLNNSNIFSSKDEGAKILKEIGLEENVRAERLTLQDFAKIADKIF
jgi:16S rRNA (adenine1518-N6/adenine1519-N6)-dimethyltransferase